MSDSDSWVGSSTRQASRKEFDSGEEEPCFGAGDDQLSKRTELMDVWGAYHTLGSKE